jgi:hypothetical protein
LLALPRGSAEHFHHVGHGKPLRRRAVKALDELDGRRFKLVLLGRGAVQVEQRQPGIRMAGARAVGAKDFQQAGFRAGIVAIGKADGGLFEFGVMLNAFGHVDGAEFGM